MIRQTIVNRWTKFPVTSFTAKSICRVVELSANHGISLASTCLPKIDLVSLSLNGADLRGANLKHANLTATSLKRVDLRGADLRGASLELCQLRNANLERADLRGASLIGADLRGANLLNADLREACFRTASLSGAILDWRWSVVPSELLRRDNAYSTTGAALVFDLDCNDCPQPFSWARLLASHPKACAWATSTLATSVVSGDNAPKFLKDLANNL